MTQSVFTLYGAFWISYATSLLVLGINAFGSESPSQRDAIGLYLMIWFIVTFFFLYVSFTYFKPSLTPSI
jgi:hypothetical protein